MWQIRIQKYNPQWKPDSFKIKKTRTTGNMGGYFKGIKLFIVHFFTTVSQDTWRGKNNYKEDPKL